MDQNILVSVIMPTYKQTDLLYKAVNSVLAQTYKNIELIVIDDNKGVNARIDNDLYFKKLADNRVVYLQNEVNMGSAKSRNKGIELAKGDFVTFLDDDDYYSNEKVERQLEFMLDNNFDGSVCNMILTNEKGKIVDKRCRNYFSNKESLLVKHLKYNITGTDTMMFKADFLRFIGGFEEHDFGDEFLLMLKAIEHTDKIGHLDYDGAFATIHSTTGLSSYDKKIETENDMLEVKSRYFNELSRKDVRFIKMRHYAVLAVAYKKGKKYAKCLINLIRSFFIAPIGFFKLYSGKCR